jgi:hypothetical protein
VTDRARSFVTPRTLDRDAAPGINMGAPVWNGAVVDDALKAAIETGATHVRVNFRLDRWASRTDAGFFDATDRIVDAITSQGLEVYGLVSDELAPAHPITSQAFECRHPPAGRRAPTLRGAAYGYGLRLSRGAFAIGRVRRRAFAAVLLGIAAVARRRAGRATRCATLALRVPRRRS